MTVDQVAGGPLTGRIAAADEDGVDLDLEPGQRRLAFRAITRAVVQVEFRSAPEQDDADGLDDDGTDEADTAAGQD